MTGKRNRRLTPQAREKMDVSAFFSKAIGVIPDLMLVEVTLDQNITCDQAGTWSKQCEIVPESADTLWVLELENSEIRNSLSSVKLVS